MQPSKTNYIATYVVGVCQVNASYIVRDVMYVHILLSYITNVATNNTWAVILYSGIYNRTSPTSKHHWNEVDYVDMLQISMCILLLIMH